MWFDVRYIKHIKVARGRALHYTKLASNCLMYASLYLRLCAPLCSYLRLSAPICTYLRLAVQVWTYLCLPAAIDVALHQAHQSLVSALVCRFGVTLPQHQTEFCCTFAVV